MDDSQEIEVLRHEFKEFLERDLPQQYLRAKGLINNTASLLSSFSFTVQLSSEDHLEGTIRLEGFLVKSAKIRYKQPKERDFNDTQIIKSFPLENIQRSHHFLNEVIGIFGKLNFDNRKAHVNINALLEKNEEMLVTIQNAIDQFILPYSSIYSSFPHMNEKFMLSKIKYLQKRFDPPLKKEIVIEINVFEAKLVVSFHQVKFSPKKKVSEIKMKAKGRFVEIETDDINKLAYIKRSYRSSTDIGYFLRSVSNLSESVDILKRINDKLRIFSRIKFD